MRLAPCPKWNFGPRRVRPSSSLWSSDAQIRLVPSTICRTLWKPDTTAPTHRQLRYPSVDRDSRLQTHSEILVQSPQQPTSLAKQNVDAPFLSSSLHWHLASTNRWFRVCWLIQLHEGYFLFAGFIAVYFACICTGSKTCLLGWHPKI